MAKKKRIQISEERQQIGKRLQECLKDKFGNVSNAEKEMNKPNSTFANYISGKTMLGGKLRDELSSLGIDINYILKGIQTVNEPTTTYKPTDDNKEDTIKSLNDYIKVLKKELEECKSKLVFKPAYPNQDIFKQKTPSNLPHIRRGFTNQF